MASKELGSSMYCKRSVAMKEITGETSRGVRKAVARSHSNSSSTVVSAVSLDTDVEMLELSGSSS